MIVELVDIVILVVNVSVKVIETYLEYIQVPYDCRSGIDELKGNPQRNKHLPIRAFSLRDRSVPT